MEKVIIEHLEVKEIEKRNIYTWPVWSKEVSRFDWYYDGDEECLLLEGEVEVETPEGICFLKKGDFVTFKKGLACVWNVKKPIKKHYNFPE